MTDNLLLIISLYFIPVIFNIVVLLLLIPAFKKKISINGFIDYYDFANCCFWLTIIPILNIIGMIMLTTIPFETDFRFNRKLTAGQYCKQIYYQFFNEHFVTFLPVIALSILFFVEI